MKILFIMDRRVNAGSIQAVAHYATAGDQFGHTIALYGRPDSRFPQVHFSTDIDKFDQVVFILESGLHWLSGLRAPRILESVPREKRAILDADGMYNDQITVDGYDRNHATDAEHKAWMVHCDLIADRVFQPTWQPRHRAVNPLPFYGYSPSSHIPRGAIGQKNFDIVYVAHNWWRWKELNTHFLPALEQIRSSVNEVCFVGSWWDAPPAAIDPRLGIAFHADRQKLCDLRIRVKPAVPFTHVVQAMSDGRINVMTQRPLLRTLRLFTSKYFEIFCADTIPLVMLDFDHAEAVYGPAGRELVLNGNAAEKILDALQRPRKYREIVEEVRRHLLTHHSYSHRVNELVVALSVASSGGVEPCI